MHITRVIGIMCNSVMSIQTSYVTECSNLRLTKRFKATREEVLNQIQLLVVYNFLKEAPIVVSRHCHYSIRHSIYSIYDIQGIFNDQHCFCYEYLSGLLLLLLLL